MIQCELCRKVVRTTQGLRGHKTFVHGIHADGKQSASQSLPEQQLNILQYNRDQANSRNDQYTDTIESLKVSISCNIDHILELRNEVDELRNTLQSLSTRNEISDIVKAVNRLNNRLRLHDEWLNPKGMDEIIHGMSGGPIIWIEKRLNNHQCAINWIRKRCNLGPIDTHSNQH